MSAILVPDYEDEFTHFKVPPHSNEAEQSVIGGLLLKSDKFYDIQGIVEEAFFYRQDHQLIFRSMKEVIETDGQFDIITLQQWLKDRDELEGAGGLAYLGTLAKDTPSAANIVNYAKIVAKKYQFRQLISIGTEIADASFNENYEPSEIIQSYGGDLDTVLDNQIGDTLDMAGIHDVTFKAIEENIEARKTKSTTGIPSGLPEIDKRLGGFQKKRVYLLAARPGGGKTALSNQFAIHASINGFKVGILSLEMGTEELGLRMLAHFYQVSGTALLFGNATENTKLKSKIQRYKANNRTVLADADLKLDTDTYSLAGITARMTQWKRKHGLDMVVIDHVGLVENKGNNRNESVGEVSRTIKKMAKRLDIAILELVQLNRENVKNNRRPQESDLRDSGSLEQDADVIIFLHVDDKTKGDEIRDLDIGLSKVRYGIPGWIPEVQGGPPFGFEGQTQTIREKGSAIYKW